MVGEERKANETSIHLPIAILKVDIEFLVVANYFWNTQKTKHTISLKLRLILRPIIVACLPHSHMMHKFRT